MAIFFTNFLALQRILKGDKIQEAVDQEITLWTIWDVISETATLLYRFHAEGAISLDEIKPALQIVE